MIYNKYMKSNILKSEAREYILKIAKQMFLEKGYNNTSIRDIAKKGNLSLGRIYVYFKKKEDILIAIVQPLLDMGNKLIYPVGMSKELEDEKIAELFSKEKIKENLYKGASIIKKYKEEVYLLLFKSEGFKAFDLREITINAYMHNYKIMMDILKSRGYIDKSKDYNNTAISIAKLYLSVSEELSSKNLSDSEYENYIEDLTNFIYYGNLGALGKIKLNDMEDRL